MKAIALTPGTDRLRLADRPEPTITAPDEVKVRVLQVGICGTDGEEAAGGRAEAPPGESELVIGHEMLGQVVAVGSAVSAVQPGDYAVFTVRRSCGRCPACAIGRSDMCYTGDYAERGIKGRHGYQAEYVVDSSGFTVRVPGELASVGVLTEPMSVAEKAIDEATRVQLGRLPDVDDHARWLNGKQVLVAGLGPVGLLAAFALRLRGARPGMRDKRGGRPGRPSPVSCVAGAGNGTRPDGRPSGRTRDPRSEVGRRGYEGVLAERLAEHLTRRNRFTALGRAHISQAEGWGVLQIRMEYCLPTAGRRAGEPAARDLGGERRRLEGRQVDHSAWGDAIGCGVDHDRDLT